MENKQKFCFRDNLSKLVWLGVVSTLLGFDVLIKRDNLRHFILTTVRQVSLCLRSNQANLLFDDWLTEIKFMTFKGEGEQSVAK